MGVQGHVVVGTKLDTSNFDKEIDKLEKKLEKMQDKFEEPIVVNGVKINGLQNATEKELKQYEKMQNKLHELYDQKYRLADAEQKIGEAINQQNNSLSQQNNKVSEINRNNENSAAKLVQISTSLEEMLNEYRAIENADIVDSNDMKRMEELRKSIEKARREYEKLSGTKLNISDIDGAVKKQKNLGNTIERNIKKIGRMVLAIFSIRTAYGAISAAVSILSSENEQLAADIENIRYGLASALMPVIEKIIDLMYTLMKYINYLWSSWTGEVLFSSKNADNLNDANKEAQKLQKTLTGFDEMNVVSSSSSSSSSTSSTSPSQDFTELPDEVPGWLKTIEDFGAKVIDVFNWMKDNWWIVVIGIIVGAGLIALAVLGIKKAFFGAKDGASAMAEGFGNLLSSMGTAAIIISILGGLALVLDSVANLIKTFSESGLELNDVLILLGGILAEVGIFMGVLAGIALLLGSNPLYLIAIVALVGAVSAILLVVAATLPTILDALGKFINDVAPVIIDIIETINKGITDIIYALGDTLPPILDSIGSIFTNIFEGIAKVVGTVGGIMIDILKELKSLIKTVLREIVKFIDDLGPAINNFVDNVIAAITKLINFLVSGIEYLINTLIIDSINGLISNAQKVADFFSFLGFEVELKKVKRVSIERFRPRLAQGGIINLPGKGVPLGGYQAIGGEAGQEGVIPLTDSQAMATLGEAIGRYITIDLTNVTQLDGRTIARNTRQVQNSRDFAMNR